MSIAPAEAPKSDPVSSRISYPPRLHETSGDQVPYSVGTECDRCRRMKPFLFSYISLSTVTLSRFSGTSLSGIFNLINFIWIWNFVFLEYECFLAPPEPQINEYLWVVMTNCFRQVTLYTISVIQIRNKIVHRKSSLLNLYACLFCVLFSLLRTRHGGQLDP